MLEGRIGMLRFAGIGVCVAVTIFILTGSALAQIEWTKYNEQPNGNSDYVLDVGPSGAWDADNINEPTVVYHRIAIPDKIIPGRFIHYEMWFSGDYDTGHGIDRRVGYATSPNGVEYWEKYNDPETMETLFVESDPVLPMGLQGEWDEDGVLLPCVIFDKDTTDDNQRYKMWYSGYGNGKFSIGYATSKDGITWFKHGPVDSINNPALHDGLLGLSGEWDESTAYRPSVIPDGNEYRMWYIGAGPGKPLKIGYATSSILDGIEWTKHGPVDSINNSNLEDGLLGSQGTWDDVHIWGVSAFIDPEYPPDDPKRHKM